MPINGANNARVPVCSPLQHNCKFRQSTYYLHVQFDLAAGGDYESPSFWYGFRSVAWYLLLIETGGAWAGTLYCSRNTLIRRSDLNELLRMFSLDNGGHHGEAITY